MKIVPCLMLIPLLLGGCVTTDTGTPAPRSTVSDAQVYRAADTLRRLEPGRTGGAGGGDSMAPIYGENTQLVIAPIAFADLKRGMIVAYRSRDGRRIVHRLEYQKGGAWIARGLNNWEEDTEPVTPENLIGVVYGVFNSAGAGKASSAGGEAGAR